MLEFFTIFYNFLSNKIQDVPFFYNFLHFSSEFWPFLGFFGSFYDRYLEYYMKS